MDTTRPPTRRTLKVVSYNSTGLGDDKVCYIKHLLNTQCPDFVFLQETWLLPRTLSRLSCIDNDFMFHSVSGVDDSELLLGRPFGGVAIMWHNGWSNYVKRINCKSRRLSVITIECDNLALLFICVYMPCDVYCHIRVSDEFLDVLDEIECLVEQMSNHQVVIGGDLNVDLARDNSHSMYFLQWLERCSLKVAWCMSPSPERFTYADLNQASFSCINHWVLSPELTFTGMSADVIHEGINPSKHCPIALKLNLACEPSIPRDQNTDSPSYGSKIEWHKAKPYITRYQHELDRLLADLEFSGTHASHCGDWHCNNREHLRDIDSWCDDLVQVALAADHVFPRRQQGPSRTLCGWDESVGHFKSESLFWHDVWNANGRPKHGWLFNQMRVSKKDYMYAVRRLKRRQKELKASKFAHAIANDNSRDFFKEVKKMSCKPKPINMINGVQDEYEIASVFRKKYETLYNSVLSDSSELAQVKRSVLDAMSRSNWSNVAIDVDLVRKGVRRLNAQKKDGYSDYNSCHLIYGSQQYFCHLAKMVRAMYIHGYQPELLLNATIISIPKDYNKSLVDDNNYRGIALCSSLSKLLDIIILLRNEDSIRTSDNQFAFKKQSSTSLCTYVLKEIVHSFLMHGSRIFACFLDATKAFDRIRFDQLFSVLIKKGMSPIDIRLLLFQYEHQKCRVSWKNSFSEYFSVANGVRQGGVASPNLFCIYLDSLLNELEREGVGCHVDQHYFGCLTYADDIALLSPTIEGLQSMLNICENFCSVSKLQFNPSKSVCVCFRKEKNFDITPLTLSGALLKWSDSVRHLGHTLMFNLSEEKEIAIKRGDLVGRSNVLMSNFANMNHDVRLKVFHSQCAHLYGCQSWNLSDHNVKYFHTMYNRCVRRVLNLPYRTHTALLPHLSDRPNISFLIGKRVHNFIMKMSLLDNKIGHFVRKSLENSSSIIASNLSLAESYFDINVDENDVITAQAIHDLLFNRPLNFSLDEATEMAHYLCVN